MRIEIVLSLLWILCDLFGRLNSPGDISQRGFPTWEGEVIWICLTFHLCWSWARDISGHLCDYKTSNVTASFSLMTKYSIWNYSEKLSFTNEKVWFWSIFKSPNRKTFLKEKTLKVLISICYLIVKKIHSRFWNSRNIKVHKMVSKSISIFFIFKVFDFLIFLLLLHDRLNFRTQEKYKNFISLKDNFKFLWYKDGECSGFFWVNSIAE